MRHEWSKEEAQIVKAAWANEHGRLALTLIVERLANLHGSSMASDPYLTAHNEGRRWVGIELMHAINLPMSKLIPVEDSNGRQSHPISATERQARVASGTVPRRGSRTK